MTPLSLTSMAILLSTIALLLGGTILLCPVDLPRPAWNGTPSLGMIAEEVDFPQSLPYETHAKRQRLQDVVTWHNRSLMIRGERLMVLSGEFHPFRLPVPSLWLDIFQKMKALGLNACSFYTYWALYEGRPGHFSSEGIFDLVPFFQAAKEAGIYLIARPGPYISELLAFLGPDLVLCFRLGPP